MNILKKIIGFCAFVLSVILGVMIPMLSIMVISIKVFDAEPYSAIADITIGLATLSAMLGGLFSGRVVLDHLPLNWHFMSGL